MQTADANSNVERPRGPAFSYAPGSRPLDGYVIKRGVGQGGFGEVYFAVSDAGKEVALKVVRRNLDVELRGVTQCLNLKHPNLVGLYDVRVDKDGNHWIVMEYVAGRRLVDVMTEHPQGLPLGEALRWFRGIAAGTAYLHQSGIVHRDLKPANLFIENDLVKLGDYGLAKFISVSRRSGQTESVGTVHYMAPEIANGRYGKQIDIYALGVILYELTTGRVPFDGESVGEILMKHLTAEPDLAAVPEAVRPAVAAALAKDPELRPKSVDEFLAMVDGAAPSQQASYGIAAAPPARQDPAREGPGPKSDVKLLHPTLPHPAEGRSATAWYRPTIVGITVFGVFAAIFLLRSGHYVPGRLAAMMAGVWIVVVGVLTWARNRMAAAEAARFGSASDRYAGQAATVRSVPWFAPAVFGVTAIALMLGVALLRTMQMYDGSAQPSNSWGLIALAAGWLLGVSWLARLRSQSVSAGTPSKAREPAAVRHPSNPQAANLQGQGPQGATPVGRLLLAAIVVGVAMFVLTMFFAYSTHSVQQATVAVPQEGVVTVEPRYHEPIPMEPLQPPVVVSPSPQRLPGNYVPPTPQEAFSDRVTVIAPISFIIMAAVATWGLWLYRVRITMARESSGHGVDLSTTVPPAGGRAAAAAEFAASTVVALIATVVVGRIALLLRGETTSLEQMLWLSVTTGTAVTMLLAVERLFGGRPRDGWARRGPQAVAGIPVGLVSWWVSQFLLIKFERFDDLPRLVFPTQWPECFDDAAQPLWLAHVAYFGLLFFAAAWWRQTERRRSARLQISEIVLALLWAGVVNMFMPFPQPWGFLVAGTTATVVQFAAPWRDAGIEKALAAKLRGRK
jgi:hypothetical protein